MTHQITATAEAAYMELAYEAANVACFALSTAGELKLSPQALALLDISAAEAPTNWQAFVRRYLQGDAPGALGRLIETRDPSLPAVRLDLSRSAGTQPQRRIVAFLRAAGADDGQVVGVLHDQTAVIQREAERFQVSDRLQQLGRWSLLGEMASGLAHELNQPLAAISAFSQAGERMLGREPPQVERAKSLFNEVSQQALRAGAVIERMRALIKRQTGHPQSVACVEILSEFQELALPIARAHQARLQTEPADSHVRVLIDRSHIQQVLMSLFRNALDAMQDVPPAERQIQVRAQIVGNLVELSIADTGPGIPAEVGRELFRPFFTTKPEGTGLGLAVCRSIVAEHGGTLRFVNGERGVRFIVSLPQAE